SHQRVDDRLPSHPAHQPTETDVHMGDAQLATRAQQMEVVDALDLRVVGVDDLPVEDVLRERNLARQGLQRFDSLRSSAKVDRALVPTLDVLPIDALYLAAQPGADAERRHARICARGVRKQVDEAAE